MKSSIFLNVRFQLTCLLLLALLLPRLCRGQEATNPVVDIVSPTNGQVYNSVGFEPTSIQIVIRATDSGAPISRVAIFSGTNLLGTVSNFIILDPPGINGVTGPVYFLTWSDVPAGTYSLTATATDTEGASATSPAVTIRVGKGLPVVRITSPPNNAVFRAPMDIPITAFAQAGISPIVFSLSNIVTNVEFYAGTNDLGTGRRLITFDPLHPIVPVLTPFQFELTWSNTPPGSYPLTAVATDEKGNSATSAAIDITILPALPPPTNLLDIVGIVTTDPIAIAGTNSWIWRGPITPFPSWTNWPPTNVITFTNWGPKDALFTVFRLGSIESNLNVAYSIGGTATNGVEYATLSGTVTIPSGAASALITIVPIATNPAPEQTVILTLEASSNTPPDYVVGFPPRAEALILENWPRPLPVLLPGGSFNFNETGPDGAWFRADWSSNLLDWSPLCTNQVFDGSIDFLDADAAANPFRYYRAVPLSGPPQ